MMMLMILALCCSWHKTAANTATVLEAVRLCHVSRHEGKADDVDRLDLGHAAAIIPINWANRSRWMHRRCARERG